jgi:3-hydroxyisobutyrate dehydrogenase-like beta-hydroxyacid dehydrogenase
MGISVAASAQNSGCSVYWASEGRSDTTIDRATQFNLVDARTMAGLCEVCSLLISVCPPAAAESVADQVLSAGYQGTYLDANAISPHKVQKIGQKLASGGIRFVDGGIIGGPAWEPDRTWLYLAGEDAESFSRCFTSGPLETANMGDTIGKASALKMTFAAYTKGTSALLSAILAVAEGQGVLEDLLHQWSRGGSDFSEETIDRVRRVTAKAWRFEGEMYEIADTFARSGLPDGFHQASAEVFHRMAGFKRNAENPTIEDVLIALLGDA